MIGKCLQQDGIHPGSDQGTYLLTEGLLNFFTADASIFVAIQNPQEGGPESSTQIEEAYLFIDMPAPAFGVQLVYADRENPEIAGHVAKAALGR